MARSIPLAYLLCDIFITRFLTSSYPFLNASASSHQFVLPKTPDSSIIAPCMS